MIYSVYDSSPTFYSSAGSLLGFVSLCPSMVEDHHEVYRSLVKNRLIKDICNTNQIYIQTCNWRTNSDGSRVFYYTLNFTWMEAGKKRAVKLAGLWPWDKQGLPISPLPNKPLKSPKLSTRITGAFDLGELRWADVRLPPQARRGQPRANMPAFFQPEEIALVNPQPEPPRNNHPIEDYDRVAVRAPEPRLLDYEADDEDPTIF